MFRGWNIPNGVNKKCYEQRRVEMCYLFMNTYSLWLELAVVTLFNMVRPASPEFLSFMLVGNGLNMSGCRRILATAVSCLFQAHVLFCMAQTWYLISGPGILFKFTMQDFLKINT